MQKKHLFLALVLIISTTILAQKKFQFEKKYDVATTPVKSQDKTGTCWSYCTTSFVESEILRQGGPEMDLSEMYFVRYTYLNKAQKYIFLHGKGNYSQGSLSHDVMHVIQQYGFVPDVDYTGLTNNSKIHDHSELEAVTKGMLNSYIGSRNAVPNKRWYESIELVLDVYLGKIPATVKYNSRTYSPQEFAKALGISADNYIEFSSYSHHPFYKNFVLEIPDNWADGQYINLPLDELIEVMKNALAKGYSIAWDGDVSEKSFSHKRGIAILPLNTDSMVFKTQKELTVTQQNRQAAFLSWKTTDDHLMHITGLYKDQKGTLYFKTKNSWGTKVNPYNGFLYMSEAYVRMNTVGIMIHKEGVANEILKKIQ